MKSLFHLLLICGLALSLPSCTKSDPVEEPQAPDNGKLMLKFEPYFQNEPLTLGEIYETSNGYRIQVENFLFYLSDFQATLENGSTSQGMDIVLMEFNNSPMELSFDMSPGNYSGFTFAFGVPQEVNVDSDPTQFPNSHPLSVQGSNGMFWQWNTGYIFTKFDGRADLTGVDGNPLDHTYAFHCGNDQFYETREYPDHSFSVTENQTTVFTFRIQVDQFLDNPENPIDIAEDDITHSSGVEGLELAQKLVNNFYDATTLEE